MQRKNFKDLVFLWSTHLKFNGYKTFYDSLAVCSDFCLFKDLQDVQYKNTGIRYFEDSIHTMHNGFI